MQRGRKTSEEAAVEQGSSLQMRLKFASVMWKIYLFCKFEIYAEVSWRRNFCDVGLGFSLKAI
jgi:hypothetical protein